MSSCTRRALAALVVAASAAGAASAQCEVDYVVPGPTPFSGAGAAVGLHAGQALVGAPAAEIFPGNGAVYFYERGATGWQAVDALVGSFAAEFGSAFARLGDTLFVGAPQQAHEGLFVGAVFEFDLVEGRWLQAAQHSGAVDFGRYGELIDASNGRFFVAGPTHPFLPGPGLVDVYEPSGGDWARVASLTPSTAIGLGGGGASLAADRDALLVGTPNEFTPTTPTGWAGVFEFDGTGWTETASFASDTPLTRDLFGGAVDLRGNTLLIGARAHTGTPGKSGTVFVYERLAGGWTQTAKLTASGLDDHVGFGSSVVLLAGRALIAEAGDPATNRSGSLYLFEKSPQGWLETARIVSGSGGLFLPTSLAWDGDVVVVGQEHADSFQPAAGAVSFFSTEEQGCTDFLGAPIHVRTNIGGEIGLVLNAGQGHAFELYSVLGSATGTVPGQAFGALTVPLNFDGYYLFTLLNPGAWIADSLGFLDEDGRARAAVDFAPGLDPSLAGVTLHHAYVTFAFDGAQFLPTSASQPEALTITASVL